MKTSGTFFYFALPLIVSYFHNIKYIEYNTESSSIQNIKNNILLLISLFWVISSLFSHKTIG